MTDMNTGAASLLPCPFCGSKNTTIGYSGQPARAVFAMCSACGASGPVQAFHRGMTFDWEECWNRRATPTPQADAAPIISGHEINDLFLKWSEWTTELGEAISRKNIDGFVSELRAAIAAGGAQEAVTDAKSKLPEFSGCIEWSNYRNRQGYGSFKADGKMSLAHRVMY